MTMTGGGGAIVGGVLVGSVILAEETGALDGAKNSFDEWLTTGRDGVLIKSDDSSSNDNSDSQASAGTQTGSTTVGGGASLPPDDNDDNRHKQVNQKYQNQKQQERFDELRNIYDKNNPTTDLKIDGQLIRQNGGNRYTTRIYDSQNLTDKQIHNYVEELAGQPLTKRADGIYTVRLQDGTNITLRNVSHSNTGARWTVDIKGNPQMMRLENGLRNIELKFR